MRALTVAVIVMGVLIVAGVATIVVTIAKRMASGAPIAATQQAVLAEPDGTRITGLATTADRLAVQLQGGGPDRIVVLDARTGHVLLRATLGK
jgi:Family of unknown function (DUF6476)